VDQETISVADATRGAVAWHSGFASDLNLDLGHGGKSLLVADIRNAKGGHMEHGQQRNVAARAAAALGFLSGIIGFFAALTHHTWKMGEMGWFMGGALLTLLAVFALVDGAIAAQSR
jgi:hypothetical protein